jgi:hypothetical protein
MKVSDLGTSVCKGTNDNQATSILVFKSHLFIGISVRK